MKWWLGGALLLGVLTLVSWRLLWTDDRDGGAPNTRRVEAAEIQGIGYVEPASEVRQLMLRTGGVIRRCHVKVGDTVEKDHVLLELEDATQAAEVALAEKDLELAQAEVNHVNAGTNPYRLDAVAKLVERLRELHKQHHADLVRAKRLRNDRAISAQEYEDIASKCRQSELALHEHEAELVYLKKIITPEHRAFLGAKLRQASARVVLAKARHEETRLRAPFPGTVLKLLKREGEGVRMFEPEAAILFGDLSRQRVRAEIDERFVHLVRPGQKASVFGKTLGDSVYHGEIVEVEKVMGKKSTFTRASSERKDLEVLQVVIDMGPGFQAPAGLQVDVRIHISKRWSAP